MTNKEAIQFLDNMRGHESGRAIGAEGFYAELCGYHVQALNIAIKALSQQTEDAISRQAVDEAIYDYSRSCDVNYAQIMEYIDKIPSVNPQEPCDDANANQHNSNALNHVGQHTNALEGDLINRQAALDAFGLFEKTRKYGGDYSGYDTMLLYEIQQTLEDLPSVTPKQRSGHWIEQDGFDGDTYYDCSECGESFCLIDGTPTDNLYNYCPNCGAKMEG